MVSHGLLGRVGRLAQGLLLATALGLTACQPIHPVDESVPIAAVESAAAAVITNTVPADVTTLAAPDAVTAVTVAVVASTPAPVTASTPDPALVEAGLAVYHAQYCGVCHTLTAAGTTGTFGPSHDSLGATAAARVASPTYTGTATTPAEYIHESIVAPEVYIVPDYALTSHHMPPYGHLPAADIDALVEFLLVQ